MKNLKNQKGFTLIELILVIVVLGILAVAALPTFIDVAGNAATASMEGVAGAVREGISLYNANELVQGRASSYPADLGGTAGSDCGAAPCFGGILEQAVTDARWTRTDATTYTYSANGTTGVYVYNSATGAFALQ